MFSQDHGVEKPDPRLYAIAEAAIPGGEYIFVGDSLINDIVAARRVGWRESGSIATDGTFPWASPPRRDRR
jgi:FMN phosphatase YigB (HAD superfamily)